MLQQNTDKYLIQLSDCIEQQKYLLIKQKLTKFAKFFFDIRSKTLLIYDQTLIYIVSGEETRVTDLGKQHPICQLSYNPNKNILLFLTYDGHVIAHFVQFKTQLLIKKEVRKQAIFGWIYGRDNVDIFLAEGSGIRLYKVDDEKKAIKEAKSTSNKFNSFLFQPFSQTLICFPVGDCKTVITYMFDDENRAKNWYKGPEVSLNFQDESIKATIKRNKSLGLKSSRINCQLFIKQQHEDLQAQIIKIGNKCYLVFYLGSEGKLKLVAITQEPQKQIMIKLPSDCLPSFSVVDSMLVIQMKNQKITFIYDINNNNAQMLVSPFPVQHCTRQINPYSGVFLGSRHIMPNGDISKWVIRVPVIYHYLKNQQQIFDFLLKRQKSKSELYKWLRNNLMTIKQINLSKFWKLIFIKMQTSGQREKDLVTMLQILNEVFVPLQKDQLTAKDPLLNILLQFLRQAKEMKVGSCKQLQKLVFMLLLQCKRYDLLVYLCHSNILKDCQQFSDTLMRKGLKQKEQALLTLSIDMASRICEPQKVFQMLILSQRVWEARRYMKQNFEKIQLLFLIYAAKGIRDETVRNQYLKVTRAFILRKLPNVTEKYLDEAQSKVFEGTSN